MNEQQFILVIAVLGLVMVWQSNYSKRNKAFCTYTRATKQEVEKFVPITARYVIFDGKKFEISPSRAKLFYWNRGLIGALFPQWVIKYEFDWFSDKPRNPNDYSDSMDTPENRYIVRNADRYHSFHEGMLNQAGKKKGILAQYGILIALAAFAIIAFLWYQDHAQLQAILNFLKVKGM